MARRKRERPPRFCLNPECQEYMDPEWAEPNQKYCTDKCRNRFWYLHNKEFHRKLYKQRQKEWARSPTGKRAGVSIRNWLKLPEDFR